MGKLKPAFLRSNNQTKLKDRIANPYVKLAQCDLYLHEENVIA